MRLSMGGWVLNSSITPPPENGFTMNRCEVAGEASMGRRLFQASSFSSALAKPYGLPVRSAPVASAAY